MKIIARLLLIIIPYVFCAAAIGIGVLRISKEETAWGVLIAFGCLGTFLATLSAHAVLSEWRD